MALAATAALLVAAGGMIPAGSPRDFGSPTFTVTVPAGWTARDGAKAKREGAGPWDLYLESPVVGAASGEAKALIVLAVGPEKDVVDPKTGAALPLEADFQGLFALVDWQHRESRQARWKTTGALRQHGMEGFLHEAGEWKSEAGELGTLEELALRLGQARLLAIGFVPTGLPRKVARDLYAMVHQTLLSVTYPCAPFADPDPSWREAGVSSSDVLEWISPAHLGVVLPSYPHSWSNVGGWSGTGGSGTRFMGETGPPSNFIERTGFDQDPAIAFVLAETPGGADLRDPSSTLKAVVDRFRANPAKDLWDDRTLRPLKELLCWSHPIRFESEGPLITGYGTPPCPPVRWKREGPLLVHGMTAYAWEGGKLSQGFRDADLEVLMVDSGVCRAVLTGFQPLWKNEDTDRRIAAHIHQILYSVRPR